MKERRIKLYAALEAIYWSDTRSRPLEALAAAGEALEGLAEEAFEDPRDRKKYRYVLDVIEAYPPTEFFSSDVRNEVRDALAMLLELCTFPADPFA